LSLERTVDEYLRELVGAARDTFLNHKILFIESFLSAYHLDPARIGYRRELIEEFLLEHCAGLTVSECFNKIEQLIRQAGGRRKLEDLADTIGKSIEDMANAMTRIDVYCASWGLDRETCDELRKIERDPCLDSNVVRKVLTGFFQNLGARPEEYKGAIEEASTYIGNLAKRRLCVRWDHVVNAVKAAMEAERARREETIARARGIQRSLEKFLERPVGKEITPPPTLERFARREAIAVAAPKPMPTPTPTQRPRRRPEIPTIEYLGRPAALPLRTLSNLLRERGKRLEILTESGVFSLYSEYYAESVRANYRARGEMVRELRFPGAEVCVDLNDIATGLVVIEFRDSFFMFRDTRWFCCRNCIQYYRNVRGEVRMLWT
jgi:hypothetical protein